jgi:regulator of nonsense transcripts 1
VPGKNGTGVGQGGVSLAGLSINDIGKQASLSQSDRLKRYVEGGIVPSVGLRGTSRLDDDDVRSVSTAFASQVGLGGYD